MKGEKRWGGSGGEKRWRGNGAERGGEGVDGEKGEEGGERSGGAQMFPPGHVRNSLLTIILTLVFFIAARITIDLIIMD